MAPRLVRWVVVAVCVAGIAGMIVASIADATGAALTFGLITAAAVACLMVATAVAGSSPQTAPVDDVRAARVEDLVQNLVAGGADEAELRQLVREASRLRTPTN